MSLKVHIHISDLLKRLQPGHHLLRHTVLSFPWLLTVREIQLPTYSYLSSLVKIHMFSKFENFRSLAESSLRTSFKQNSRRKKDVISAETMEPKRFLDVIILNN